MLKIVSFEEKDFIVMEDISKDLKIFEVDEIMVKVLRSRNAVPPPTTVFFILAGETGRGKLIRV